jgi:glycosyltransferase involved in cell wall biosynthesis
MIQRKFATSLPLPSPQYLYGWQNIQPKQAISLPDQSCEQRDQKEPLKFSLVIPTLNQGDMIEDTILSIIYQCYRNFEIIVMDGGSRDNTLEVLDRYRPWITHLVSEPDGGQSQAINKGFSLATGDIYAWINSDDYYLPKAFQRVASCFTAHNAKFVVGSGDVISKDHKFLRYIPSLEVNDYTIKNWKNDRWIMQQSCFWRQSLWEQIGGVDTSLNLLMDVDLWFRFSRLTSNVVIPEKLAVMRYYPGAKTVQQRGRSIEELAYVYAKSQAYESVREIVTDLNSQLDEIRGRLNTMQSSMIIRILKRLRILPSN